MSESDELKKTSLEKIENNFHLKQEKSLYRRDKQSIIEQEVYIIIIDISSKKKCKIQDKF